MRSETWRRSEQIDPETVINWWVPVPESDPLIISRSTLLRILGEAGYLPDVTDGEPEGEIV